MPNTKPNTDTADALADKLKRAAGRMWCEHAFYVGATNANARHLGELEMLPGAAGIKVFMGASTGDLLRSEEHTSELQSLMRISYAVFCLKKKQTRLTHMPIS